MSSRRQQEYQLTDRKDKSKNNVQKDRIFEILLNCSQFTGEKKIYLEREKPYKLELEDGEDEHRISKS